MSLDGAYHVMPWQGKWRVFVAGNRAALSAHDSRDEAIGWCRRDALDSACEGIVVYHDLSSIRRRVKAKTQNGLEARLMAQHR